ncbi:MAG TPA: hypothetical protein VD835_01740 [Pyrinomonadaceae bacterium]|nr:hypothetical protein [Pyrinomonadaceae bacterium]
MKDSDTRRYEAFLRVRDFGAERAAQFPPNSFGAEKLAALGEVIVALEKHASMQVSGLNTAQQGVSGKAAARDELRRDLEAISRTARSMASDAPGLEDKFRLPTCPKIRNCSTRRAPLPPTPNRSPQSLCGAACPRTFSQTSPRT